MSEMDNKKSKNFYSIHKEFIHHLETGNDVKKLSQNFGALISNYERVDFVVELLKLSKIQTNFYNDAKSDELAIKLRNEGNESFKMKKLKEAWELYTKSICYCESNSPSLGLAYANRSAVLFELNLQNECLTDINRALEHSYPDHLKEKLLKRQKNCQNTRNIFEKPYEPIPTIINKNHEIQSASDSLEIQSDKDFGRFVVASRNIKIGEVLVVEKPFALLVVDQFLNHCHECIKLCYNLIPCENCTQALYCSEECKELALKKYHKYECSILASIRFLELSKLNIMPLIIAFLTKELDASYNFNLITESEEYRSDRYREIHNLVTNTNKRSISDLFERAIAAAVIFNLVKAKTNFFDGANEKLEQQFKDTLLLHMQTGPSNFHEITELAPTLDGTYKLQEIGCGAFAFLSLINHSCSPNVVRFCYGSTIVMRALQDIKKGEQCFDNYGYHFAVMDKVDRQKQLQSQYYFTCLCEACNKNWPMYSHLPSLGSFNAEEVPIAKLSEGDVNTARLVLNEFLEKLSDLQKFQPCVDFCNLQEIIKQCYAIFGNKRRLF